MTDLEYKLETAQRLARIETNTEMLLKSIDAKASKSSVGVNRRLIYFMLTLMFAITAKVSTATVLKRDFAIVRKEAKSYSFKLNTDKTIHNFQAMSCHRHFYEAKEFKLFSKKNKTVEFLYEPLEIELDWCPLHFGIFGKSGLSKIGFVDFESKNYTLKGRLLCNGAMTEFNGVAVCEAKRGLTQRITFSKDVKMVSPCMAKPIEGKVFDIKVEEDSCLYMFGDSDKNRARLTLLAYDRV